MLGMMLLEARRPKNRGHLSRRPLKTRPDKPAEITKADLAKGQKPSGVSWKDWLAAGGSFGKGAKPKASGGSHTSPKKKSSLPNLNPAYRATKYQLRVGKEIVSRWKRRWGNPTAANGAANIYNALVALAKEGGPIPRKVKEAAIVDARGKVVVRAVNLDIPGGKKFDLIALSALAGGDNDWDDFDDDPEPKGKDKHWGLGGKWGGKSGGGHGGGGHGGGYTTPSPAPRSPEEKRLDGILKKMHEPLPRDAAGGVVFRTFEAEDMWDLPVLVAQTAQKYGSKWVFPKGGLDPGESFKQGAAREVREEAGVKAKVVGSHAHVIKSTFSDLGKYDIGTVMAAAKKAAGSNKDDVAFVESQKQLLCRKFYQWQNTTHYFVMQHTGGNPNPTHVHGASNPECTNKHPTAEMQDAKWVPLRQAITMDPRMREVVSGLLRTIEQLWKTPKGVEKQKPRSLSSLRGPRKPHEPDRGPKPKQIDVHNPKPQTGKPPKPSSQTGFPWSSLY